MVRVRQPPRKLKRSHADLVGKSVDRFWGRPGDVVVGGRDDLCAPGPAVLGGPKRCKLHHVRVEIHQESLEPVATISTGRWRSS